MIGPLLTRIGEPQKTKVVERPPVPIRRRMIPVPKLPEKVPVRRIPEKEPERKIWEGIGLHVTEIPYFCPECGREMEVEDGLLYCPVHGVIYE